LHKRVIKGQISGASAGPTKIILKPPRIIPNETARLALEPNRQISSDSMQDKTDLAGRTYTCLPKIPGTRYEIEDLIAQRTRAIEEKLRQEIKQAHDSGLNEGKVIGYGEAIGQITRLEKILNDIKEDIEARHSSELERLGEYLGQAASILAVSIIGETALEYSGEILQQNLRRCLNLLKGSGKASIKINPLDYEFIKENTQILDNSDKGAYSFEFEPDASISPGGCYIETDNGAVDGRLESQIETLKNHFRQ